MNRKTIIFLVLAVLVIGGIYAYSEFNREHASAESMTAKENVTATELLAAFEADEAAATTRFVGSTEQVIAVKGTISSIEDAGPDLRNVTLEAGNDLAGVVCEFNTADVPNTWAPGSAVQVKGICTGMLMDVVLVRCVAVE